MMNRALRSNAEQPGDAAPNPASVWLRMIGLVLLRWWEEPVGVAVPLFALLIVLFAPQMPDMFADVGFFGFGFSAALLGFSAWYWTRPALQAAHQIDDAIRKRDYAKRRAGQRPLTVDEYSWEWAPRVALLAALLLAAAPLLTQPGWGPDTRLLGPVIVGIGLVLIAFALVICRLRWGLAGGARAPACAWNFRTTAIFAAAPFGWPWALGFLALSVAGACVIAKAPWLVEYLAAPTAAIAALALAIPLLVIALAICRDLVNWLLFFAVAGCTRVVAFIRRRKGDGFAPAIFRTPANVLGLALLLVLLYVLPAPDERFELRRGAVLDEPWELCGDEPYKPSAKSRPCINQALLHWRQMQLASDYPQDRAMPFIIVAVEGGASRSAAWLLSAFRLLDEKTNNKFGRFLFAISGVSGGSLGAVTYALAVNQYSRPGGGLDWKAQPVINGMTELAKGDLLSASIATYFLNDTLGRLFGILGSLWTADDRGIALEHAFERLWEKPTGFRVRPELAEGGLLALYADPRSGMPHLFLNGTGEDTGRRLITSTVRFYPGDDLFAASDDVLATRKPAMQQEDLPVATAVTNSARFPYISPAGQISQVERVAEQTGKEYRVVHRWHILDGGYFENYGARTAADLSRAVTAISNRLRLGLIPIVVVVSNDADTDRPEDRGKPGVMGPFLDDATVTCAPPHVAPAQPLPLETGRQRNEAGYGLANELVGPLVGLYTARGAHSQDALHLLRRAHCPEARTTGFARMVHVALPRPHPPEEAAPMNWVLNQETAKFLLGDAPNLPFNQQQAELLAETIEHVSSEMVDPVASGPNPAQR